MSRGKKPFSLGRNDTAALDENASLSQTSHHVQIIPLFPYSSLPLQVMPVKTLRESFYHAVIVFP
jgi:hypothetical protein